MDNLVLVFIIGGAILSLAQATQSENTGMRSIMKIAVDYEI